MAAHVMRLVVRRSRMVRGSGSRVGNFIVGGPPWETDGFILTIIPYIWVIEKG